MVRLSYGTGQKGCNPVPRPKTVFLAFDRPRSSRVWSGRAGPEYETYCKNNGQHILVVIGSPVSSQSPTLKEGVSDQTKCDVPAGIPGFRPALVSNENPHPVNR